MRKDVLCCHWSASTVRLTDRTAYLQRSSFMNDLGVQSHDGTVYEGNGSGVAFRVHPAPMLFPFRLESTIIDQESNYRGLAVEIFREDSFDPVTRIRRGRVYTRRYTNQPGRWRVQDPFRTDLKMERWDVSVNQLIELCAYQRDPLNALRSNAGRLPKVILGSDPFVSFWKIVSIETSSLDIPVLTLKALYSLGDLPELAAKRASRSATRLFREAWEHLNDSIHRGSPSAIVDRCRDVLSVVFGEKVGALEKDLGHSINEFVKVSGKGSESLVSYAGRIVARLHSRGKPNEQHAKSLRPLSDEDAQLAVRCVGLVLVETGWAK